VSGLDQNYVQFILDMTDEATIRHFETKYSRQHKLKYDGGIKFSMELTMPIKGMSEDTPELWEQFKELRPDLVSAYTLARLKGTI